jgi:agmatinase
MVYVDNKVALRQLQMANAELLRRNVSTAFTGESIAKDGNFHPRVLTLVGLDTALQTLDSNLYLL